MSLIILLRATAETRESEQSSAWKRDEFRGSVPVWGFPNKAETGPTVQGFAWKLIILDVCTVICALQMWDHNWQTPMP